MCVGMGCFAHWLYCHWECHHAISKWQGSSPGFTSDFHFLLGRLWEGASDILRTWGPSPTWERRAELQVWTPRYVSLGKQKGDSASTWVLAPHTRGPNRPACSCLPMNPWLLWECWERIRTWKLSSLHSLFLSCRLNNNNKEGMNPSFSKTKQQGQDTCLYEQHTQP